MRYIPGEGPADAKLMIVGEAPGQNEDEQGRPFVGPSGALLNSILHELDYSRDECYVTNVVKYRPPGNKFSELHRIGIDYDKCVEELLQEIKTINPNCILALGNEALKALTGYKGITTYRGSILKAIDGKTKVVPSIHPAAFLRHSTESGKSALKFSALSYVKLDYARAIEESQTRDYNIPSRRLQIARSSSDVLRFRRETSNYPRIVASDIESIKCVPSCISFAFNKKHAISIPLVPGLVDTHISTRDLAEIWRMVDEILEENEVIGQNFKYDQHKLSNPCGFPRVRLKADTAMQMHVLYPEFPKSLEFQTSICTKEPYYKSEYKEWVPGRDSYEQVLLYNAKDSAVTFEIWEDHDKELKEEGLYEFYYNFFHHCHDIYLDMEDCGLLVDLDKRSELQEKYKAKQIELQNRLNLLCGRHLNVNSPKQMQSFLYTFLNMPRRKDASEETIVALMNNVVKKESDAWKRDAMKLVLDLRKVCKTRASYLNAKPDFDGRMRTQYNINGTENGRTSTSKVDSKKRINRPVFTGLGFQTFTKHGTVGADLRYIFIPDPGHVFVNMDFSQAEPRIVAVLAKDDDLLDKFNRSVDVHSELGAFIQGNSTWDGKRLPEDQRFLGKTGRNAYNYNVGKRTFMQSVNTDAEKFGIDVRISEWKAGKILEAVRNKYPTVETIFHEELKQILEETRTLYNPFGRRRQFFDRWDDSLLREAMAYIPQSTVRDQMLKLMIDFRKSWPKYAKKIALEAHDAILLIIELTDLDDIARWLKAWPDSNLVNFTRCSLSRNINLKLPCDVEFSDKTYKDLTKYRFANVA